MNSYNYQDLASLYQLEYGELTGTGQYHVYTGKTREAVIFKHTTIDVKKAFITGWKAHISITPDQVEAAYGLIFPILSSHKVPSFKVTNLKNCKSVIQKFSLIDNQVHREAIQRIKRLNEGLQFTIYLEGTDDKEIQDMFLKIEKSLIDHDIRPGKFDKSDLALGKYISIRHQGTNDYLAARYCDNYNPESVKVPYQPIIVEKMSCRIL